MIKGKQPHPARALVAHLDTLGAMVKNLKSNGRCVLTPIGFWSSRFAEGARCTIFTEAGPKRGTILPLKASGHTFNEEIDRQPTSWDHVELRIDEPVYNKQDLQEIGVHIGDFIAIDPQPEFTNSGYLVSRHLDNKAGVACLLAAAKAIVDSGQTPEVTSYFLLTISEEVGSGASSVLHGDVSEMVSIDNSTVAEGQNSIENGITIAMKDSTGPFDYHLTQKLITLAKANKLRFERDVYRYYRCDAASAIEAGNDIRTALVSFGCDASHGYERTHIDSLTSLTELLCHYLLSPLTVQRDVRLLGGLEDFPHQPEIAPPKAEIQDTVSATVYNGKHEES